MAVKKSAKKSVAKKAPAKKVAAKKLPAKKIAKKSPAKKSVIKKSVAKKASAKKVAKKSVAKKAVAKKAVIKKAVAKKAPATKVAPKAPDHIVIDAITPIGIDSSRTQYISTTPTPRPTPVIASSELSNQTGTAQSQKSSSRVVLAVIVGVILIAVFVVARNHNTTNTPPPATPSVTPTAVETPATPATPTTPPSISSAPTSAAPGSANSTTDLPPVGIVAHYNSTGATIFWRADTNSAGLTTYNIEKSSDGGVFKLIATVPSTQLSLNVTETDTVGWSSFKVSAVYPDGNIVAGKVFGLPGQYS